MAIMKNFVKLFVVILAAAILLGSCDLLKKGGTITVKNELNYDNYVSIVKVDTLENPFDNPKVKDAFETLKKNGGTKIEKNGKKTFSFDEDGAYILAAYPAGCALPITLLAGAPIEINIVPKEN